jgi:hypothetical protein
VGRDRPGFLPRLVEATKPKRGRALRLFYGIRDGPGGTSKRHSVWTASTAVLTRPGYRDSISKPVSVMLIEVVSAAPNPFCGNEPHINPRTV